MDVFRILTPIVYWLLIISWMFIFIFYLRKLADKKGLDQLIRLLLLILAFDAFSSLFESSFFGIRYTSLVGLLPITISNFLIKPQIVFIPKLLNLVTSYAILFFLIKKWIPAEIGHHTYMQATIASKTDKLEQINKELRQQKELLDEAQSMANIGHWELNIDTGRVI